MTSSKASAILGLSPPPPTTTTQTRPGDVMYNLSIDSFSSFNPSFNSLHSESSSGSPAKQTEFSKRSPTAQTMRASDWPQEQTGMSQTYVNDMTVGERRSPRRPPDFDCRSLHRSTSLHSPPPASRVHDLHDEEGPGYHELCQDSIRLRSPRGQERPRANTPYTTDCDITDAFGIPPSPRIPRLYEHERFAKSSDTCTRNGFRQDMDHMQKPQRSHRPPATTALSMSDFFRNDNLEAQSSMTPRHRPQGPPSLFSVQSHGSSLVDCIHGSDCCLTGCTKRLIQSARGTSNIKLLPFPAFSQTLGLECILNEGIIKLDTNGNFIDPRRWKAKKGLWLEKTLIVTTNAHQAQGALPSKIASLTGAATLGTSEFSFDRVRADDAFAALHCCRDNASGSHSREEERLLLSSDSYVAVAESSNAKADDENENGTHWVLKISGTEISSSRKVKTRAQELEKQVWHLQFDTLGRLLHWQKTLRALIKALLATEDVFRLGERPLLGDSKIGSETAFPAQDSDTTHSPKSSYDSVVRRRIGSSTFSIDGHSTAASTQPSSATHHSKMRLSHRAHFASTEGSVFGDDDVGHCDAMSGSVHHAFNDGKNFRQARTKSSAGRHGDALGLTSKSVDARNSILSSSSSGFRHSRPRRGSSDRGTGRLRAMSRGAIVPPPPALPPPSAELPQTPAQKKEGELGLKRGSLQKSTSSDAIHSKNSIYSHSSLIPSPDSSSSAQLKKSPSMQFPLPPGSQTGASLPVADLEDSDLSEGDEEDYADSSRVSGITSRTASTSMTYGSEPKTPSGKAHRSLTKSISTSSGQTDRSCTLDHLASFLDTGSPDSPDFDVPERDSPRRKVTHLQPSTRDTHRDCVVSPTNIIEQFIDESLGVPSRSRLVSLKQLLSTPDSPAFASSSDSDLPRAQTLPRADGPRSESASPAVLAPPPLRPRKSFERSRPSLSSGIGVDTNAYAM